MSQRPKVVVVGAGFGGLAAAIRLQARGFSVTLLDKRDMAGGRAYVYRDQGFTFDGGPTVVTAPFLFDELFALAGERRENHITFVPVDPFYRVRFDDGRIFNYNGDADAMAEEVRKLNPADVDGYQRFVAETAKIFHVGFEQLADVPFHRALDMVKLVPQMMKLRSHLSVHALVAKYIKDPQLRMVCSFHPLLVGGNPFSTTSIYSLIAFLERKWGVWYALGGTGAIVRALVALFERLGGELRVNAEVEQIVVERGRATGVRLTDGTTLPAALVVANSDAPTTYAKLLPSASRRDVSRLKYSMGLFVSYFGTKRQYPELAHHSILLGPRYRPLLTEIFDGDRLPDDFSLYLHAPTRSDPSMAPPGCEAFYVLSPVPNLQAGVDWESEGAKYQDKILDYLERTCIPGLREHLVTKRFITPLTFRDELASLNGSAFSIQPTLRQSAYFRFHNKADDVRGLYFVGAGTHPGAGMPGVLCSAKIVDRLVADRDGTGNPRDPIAGTHA
jgi:phytoene desaturase